MRVAHDRDLALVLHVEDNPGDALLVREAFEEAQVACRLHLAADGEESLQFLETSEERAALVLLDLNLPRQNGLEVLRALKGDRRWRSLPVLVFTSSCAAKDMEAAYELHCNAYLVKPSAFEDYVRLARSIGDFWFNSTMSCARFL